ncbi:MAG: RsmE family RNA methyltransferase [Brevinema sp.]
MRRFNFSEIPEIGDVFEAPSEQVKHLTKVLRMKEGDQFEASNGTGFVYTIAIVSLSMEQVLLKVLDKKQGREIPLRATAFISELKSDAMDDSIAILAEQGIQRIIPFFSERSISKYDAKVAKKQDRRQKIAHEAIKKVGGLYDCVVEESLSWKNLPNRLSAFDQKILFWELDDTKSASLEKIDMTKDFAFIIGPEGGFSEKEVETLLKAGASCHSLGTRILTAPSAAGCAAVLFRYLTEKPFQ